MEDGYDTHLMFNRAYKVFFHNCCVREFVNKVVKHCTHKKYDMYVYVYMKVQVCMQWNFQQNISAVIMILTLVLKISFIWDPSLLTVGTVRISALWDVMLCILVKIHIFPDEGGSRILWNTSTLPCDCIISNPEIQQPLCVQLNYVLMLHDFNFIYYISHFSSWKMLPKITCIWRCGMLW